MMSLPYLYIGKGLTKSCAVHSVSKKDNGHDCEPLKKKGSDQQCSRGHEFILVLINKLKGNSIFKTVLLTYNSHTIKFTHLKHTVPWFLVSSQSYPRHHCLIAEHASPKKECTSRHFPSCLAPRSHKPTFCLHGFT